MNALIIIGYNRENSFCHLGIKNTIIREFNENDINFHLIDLYEDKFDPSEQQHHNDDLVKKYQSLMQGSQLIIFISPVYWFRCTAMLEGFFDQVFTPGFAYKFKKISNTYGIPTPLLKKRVITYLTHGAPALPVLTLYLNAVKMRLSLGVYSFVFGWFKTKIRQFFSVPFVSDKKRNKYLLSVKKDIQKEIKNYEK
jgi:NAD(P)H dehydrogenase (quinone)